MTRECKTASAMEAESSASPFSTGGGGTVFEMKVQAGLLAVLLVHGHVPLFENAPIHELHLQAERLGYETDDALVVALDSNGQRRRQLWSMKHEVKFTKSDAVFQKVIEDAWADFADENRFHRDLDAIVLATARFAKTYEHLLTLLQFARAALSAEDFLARISRKGFVSQKCRAYLSLIQTLCNGAAGRDVTRDELWQFIRCFHILSYDFDQSASQDEARFKTLLALAVHQDTGQTGDELWNAIFKWVADGNPNAGSFTRDSLPVEWQQAATGIAMHFESGAIHRLLEHSEDLLKRIRTWLGPKLHLPRKELIEQLGTAFVSERFTLVTGKAGAGKSAAAFVALKGIRGGAPLFVFQATEFARDNLDHALADLRVAEPLSRISALFALHPRKFVLIESIERLLESTQRDAFFMLLGRLAEDPTWRVILTCRQHAAAMVRDAFLSPLDPSCAEITVPLLNDAELNFVIQRVPGLQLIAADPRTRKLLRNPWHLDKACAVDWNSESSTATVDERRLRDVLWRQVVVREDFRAGGMHLQREQCFRDLALRRARLLQSFVACQPGQEAAVQALIADELLVEEPGTHGVAPADDVLEDWALVRWVTETYSAYGHEPTVFFDILGYELPIRRSYRQWLRESLAACDMASMRTFVDGVLSAPGVEPYWKDETLVSVLLSDEAPRFVENHEPSLLANDKRQFQRLIHLLRVACKKPNPLWALSEEAQAVAFGDLYLVPDGVAWGAIVRLVHRNLDSFGISDLSLVLGLLEDYKAGITWQEPMPDGAREVGLIALHFLNTLDDHYRWKEHFERLTSIILAVPHAISDEFNSLLREVISTDMRSQRFEVLQEKLLTSLECWASCRSHPEAVAALAEKSWGIDCPTPDGSEEDGTRIDLNAIFGLTGRHAKYFPASALQGPFLALLRESPSVGIDLILKLSNVAVERYVELQLLDKGSGGPMELEVDFGDGTTCRQWANPRLWMMYRGGMPGPYVLQSALMALEKWLLDLAESGQDLRDLARGLILRSNNVSVTAVVASVAMAYPHKLGDTALALMRTPGLFNLDLRRYVHDRNPVSSAFSDWAYIASKRIYNRERTESDKLPHRKQNLELLACNLQTGPFREDVWGIIDEFKVKLPPPEEQDERHKLWRLRLHRSDLRNFVLEEKLQDGRVSMIPGPPDPDVVEIVEKTAPAMKASEEIASIMAWGMAVFDGRDPDKFDPGRWREMLDKVLSLVQEHGSQDADQIFSHEDASGYTVAVCVREHWNELNSAERSWCREFLLSRVTSGKDTGDERTRIQSFPMASSRAAARVLPLLLDEADEPTELRVREAIAAALTHAVGEVQEYAAVAVGRYLWTQDADLASACIAGLLDLAQLERSSLERLREQPFGSRGKLHDLVWKGIGSVRARIVSKVPVAQHREDCISVVEPVYARVLPLIASIIMHQQENPLAQKSMLRIAESLAHSWARARQNNRQRDYEAEATVETQFANFVVYCDTQVALDLWEPLVNAIPSNASEVAEAFKELIYAEDSANRGKAFWAIWQQTRDHLVSLPDCHERLAREHSGLTKLASVLLLDNVPWQKDARNWKPLHGHERKLQVFFECTGSAPAMCKSFIRLLDSVGSKLLPEALVWLDVRLQHGDPAAMIGDRNPLFHLARILTPLVFSQTNVLRSSPRLRDSTLRILDSMVDQGSSAAFRMRDFLVTPIAPLL